MPIDTPRGVRDFSPADAISRRYIVGVIEEVFKRFGFYPIETPALENTNVLNAKAYGDEPTKEIYKLEGEETGLRYDLTVPLARYMASNKDLTLPFKRYQIAQIWRKEEPQKMRYREFTQADIDTVGSNETESDAEIVAAISIALEELGIRNYVVVINDRQLLQKILTFLKVPAEMQTQAIRILDKLQKTSRDEVKKQLSALGLKGKDVETLLNFIQQEGTNEEKLEKVLANVSDAKDEAARMAKLIEILKDYKLNGDVVVDFALARGLNYYTDFVFEFVLEEGGKRLPSVAGGGRYNNLIGLYAKKEVPAVGASIGISRIFDVLQKDNQAKTYAKVFIAYLGGQNRPYAIGMANMLRGNGIYVDLNSTSRNLSKQMEYAGSLGIKNVIIIGDKEREANKVKLRNMATGQEGLISVQEAIDTLKE